MENFILIGVFVSLGMLLRRLKEFPKDTPRALNMFALYISVPAVILLKTPHINFSRETMVAAIIPWCMLLLSAGLILLAGRFWRWPRSTVGVLLMVIPLGNTTFMGMPIIQTFFGDAGIPYLIVYDQAGTLLILATYGSFILSIYGRDSVLSIPVMARYMLVNPPFIALLVGLTCSSWLTSEKVVQSLQNISMTLTPLVMTAIGFQLHFRIPRRLIAPLGFGLMIKLIAAPVAALLACRLLGISGEVVNVSIIEAGMPPMIVASAMAVAAGMEAELAIALAGIGIICAFGTLPLLFWLIQVSGG